MLKRILLLTMTMGFAAACVGPDVLSEGSIFVRNKSNQEVYASYTLTSDARLLHIGTTTIAPGTTRHIFNFHRPVNYGAPPELEKGVRTFTLLDSSGGILHGPEVDKDEWKEECPPQSTGVNRCNTLNYVFEYE